MVLVMARVLIITPSTFKHVRHKSIQNLLKMPQAAFLSIGTSNFYYSMYHLKNIRISGTKVLNMFITYSSDLSSSAVPWLDGA